MTLNNLDFIRQIAARVIAMNAKKMIAVFQMQKG